MPPIKNIAPLENQPIPCCTLNEHSRLLLSSSTWEEGCWRGTCVISHLH
jgi:hypothetical protein